MSHNTYTVNSVEPDSSSLLSVSAAAGFGLSNYPMGRSLGGLEISIPAGSNIPLGRHPSYNKQLLGNGVTATLGSVRNVISTQYIADWFDRISLPAGTWFLKACVSQSSSSSTATGQFAWVIEQTGAIIGPVCSMRDAQRTSFCWALVTVSTPTYVSLRCISTTVYKNRYSGYGRFSMTVTKVN